MIYSLHDPVNGGFRYLEAPGQTPINDDHPAPRFSVETPLGVPSIYAGRPVPSTNRPMGKGELARGVIVSPSAKAGAARSGGMLPSGLGGLDDGPCPHWQRLTPQNTCVDKWWAPPVDWLGRGVAFALAGVVTWAFIYAVIGVDHAETPRR